MKIAEADKLVKDIAFDIWNKRYTEREIGILKYLVKQDGDWHSKKVETGFDVFNVVAYVHPRKKELVLYVQVKDTEIAYIYVFEDEESLNNALECAKSKDNHHFLRCLYSNSLAVIKLNDYYVINAP
jgi:hypothetical protein